LEERLAEPEPRERARARVAERRVLDPTDPGDADRASVREGAAAAGRPPAVAERRRGGDGDREVAVPLERDQRRPDRDPAHVVPRAVDRVDYPERGGIGLAAGFL